MTQRRSVDFSVKTVVVGESGVGKTSLLARFTRDCFEEASQPTLGIEFLSRLLDTPKNRHVELQLWDTAGQEMFRAVTRGYYRGASVVYMVFDLTNRKSFEALDRWVTELKQVIHSEHAMVLIGNKSDLPGREVSENDGQVFAAERNIKYFEASAKTGENVTKALTSALVDIDTLADQGKFQPHARSDSIVYDTDGKGAGRCC
jgi:small GTP-binding protein